MIPYDIDPSLHGGEPEPTSLDDGFSPHRTKRTNPNRMRTMCHRRSRSIPLSGKKALSDHVHPSRRARTSAGP